MTSLKRRARELKHRRAAVQKFMRNHLILNLPNEENEGVRIVSLAGKELQLHSKEAKAILTEPIAWTFHGYFVGRDNNGRNYIQSMEPVNFPPTVYDAIGKAVGKGIAKAVKTLCNPQHYIVGCWIATSEGREVDEETAYDLIERYGGFRDTARWEDTNQPST